MILTNKIIEDYIFFFSQNITGIVANDTNYFKIDENKNEYLMIAMDKVDRLTKSYGRLRQRVWSNVLLIFHDNETNPEIDIQSKVMETKRNHPYLFVRSYLYFIYINASQLDQQSLFQATKTISTSDYKIWQFNTKYQVSKLSRRTNLFDIELRDEEKIDNYIYYTNAKNELNRIKSANSDIIDCINAFKNDLKLFNQTSEVIENIKQILATNNNARILLEGPARSGKTIIAASLLGMQKDSKFLLMNYFFYNEIAEGLRALTDWTEAEVNSLVKNDLLDNLIELIIKFESIFQGISRNLSFALMLNSKERSSEIKNSLLLKLKIVLSKSNQDIFFDSQLTIGIFKAFYSDLLSADKNFHFGNYSKETLHNLKLLTNNVIKSYPNNNKVISKLDAKTVLSEIEYDINQAININSLKQTTNTKNWLLEKLDLIFINSEELSELFSDIDAFKLMEILRKEISTVESDFHFCNFDRTILSRTKSELDFLINIDTEILKQLEESVNNMINRLIGSSNQIFYHHNINRSISDKVTQGCWIRRGNPTFCKMWTDDYKPALIICDEVQRLGVIDGEYSLDSFSEIEKIISNSKQSLFTGDNYQMLNSRYDKGILEIENKLKERNENLIKIRLPETVGIPDEVACLMKYITYPDPTNKVGLIEMWSETINYEIIVICNNHSKLVDMFDQDKSIKKHFASPIDSLWGLDKEVTIRAKSREIISLRKHQVMNFAYKYPYFCNEEIMPNYVLSAYELISRELDSLYVTIPHFRTDISHKWFRNHLYVLFTRPTLKLTINIDNRQFYLGFKRLLSELLKEGAKIPIKFM